MSKKLSKTPPASDGRNVILFSKDGRGFCLYSDILPRLDLGRLRIRRATRVEFDSGRQSWSVRSPSGVLYRNPRRELCLRWEHRHFNRPDILEKNLEC